MAGVRGSHERFDRAQVLPLGLLPCRQRSVPGPVGVNKPVVLAHLRALVVISSVPPLRQLYGLIYGLVARAVAWGLFHGADVRAVYLLRSCGRGDILPGISDIDIGVFAPGRSQRRVHRLYGIFRAIVPLLDQRPTWYPLEELEQIHAHDLLRRARFEEGRTAWLHLHGIDVLATLPVADPETLAWGQWIELSFCWELITQGCLAEGPPQRCDRWEQINSRSLCYKALADLLAIHTLWRTGQWFATRQERLSAGVHGLHGAGRDLVQRFERQRLARFCAPDPPLIDDCFDFVLAFLWQRQRGGSGLPAPMVAPGQAMAVRFRRAEWCWSAHDARIVASIAALAEPWSGLEAASVVPGLWYGVEDAALVIRVDPQRRPGRGQVSAFLASARQRAAPLRRNLHLLLQIEDGAFDLDEPPSCGGFSTDAIGRQLLSPRTAPELFALLAAPDCVLFGSPYRCTLPLAWSAFQQHSIYHWDRPGLYEQAWMLYREGGQEWPARRYLSNWWKALQLLLIQRSVEATQGSADPISLPMTIPAMRVALVARGLALPSWLDRFEVALSQLLAGQPVDLSAWQARSLQFLRSV